MIIFFVCPYLGDAMDDVWLQVCQPDDGDTRQRTGRRAGHSGPSQSARANGKLASGLIYHSCSQICQNVYPFLANFIVI